MLPHRPLTVPPDRRRRIALPDGRILSAAEWGAPDASPVLFMPGAATSASLGFGADALGRLGLRLVAIDRPGLGGSSPDPDKSFDSVARDVAALCRDLGADRPAAVGFSQGAPFALALAAAGLVGALALAAPQDELAHPSLRPLLSGDVGTLVDAVGRDPAGTERMFAAMADAEGMAGLILSASGPEDRAVYEDPAFRPRLDDALREGFANGAGGYARDLVLALGRWPFDLASIDVPVAIWCGALDASPVHSPDRGATLARRLPRAERHLVADAGGAILWTHAADILESLASLARSAEPDIR